MRLLITGGTGSFGNSFIKKCLSDNSNISQIVVFSRDELKQYEMAQSFTREQLSKMRFFLGDIRDQARLKQAFDGVDIVVHAAALKQVPAAEYNPFEFVNTNVIGAQNVVEAALNCGVKKVVALSTDKASAPINLYGASKLCSDKIFVAANNIVGRRATKFVVVRYGNVFGSRGSVVPFFNKIVNSRPLPVTDQDMTRFSISLDEGVKMVEWSISFAKGGEILVPKIPSYRIMDLVSAFASSFGHEVVGLRPGEKIHEEMINVADSFHTVDLGNYYAILPNNQSLHIEEYCEFMNAKPVQRNFSYNSGDNNKFLSVEDLRLLIDNWRKAS